MLPKWDHNIHGHFQCLVPQLEKSKDFLGRAPLCLASWHLLVWHLCFVILFISPYALSQTSQSRIVGETGKVLLEWQEVSGASGYYVEIASDHDFEHILFSKTLMATTLQWEFEQTGIFYLHVATINAQGQVGSFTDPIEIQIVKSIPKKLPEPVAVTSLPKPKPNSPPKPIVQTQEITRKPAVMPSIPLVPSIKPIDVRPRHGTKISGHFKPTYWKYQLSGLPTKTKLSGVMFNSGGVSVDTAVNSWLGIEAGYFAAGTEILKDYATEVPIFIVLNELHLGLSLQRDVLASGRLSFGVGGGHKSFPLLWRDSSGKVQYQQIAASSAYADLAFHYSFTHNVMMKSHFAYDHSIGSGTVKSSSNFLIGTEVYFLPSSSGIFWGGGGEYALFNTAPKKLYDGHQAKLKGSLQSMFLSVGWWLPSIDSQVVPKEQIKTMPEKKGTP